MAAVEELIIKLKALPTVVEKVADIAIEENESDIVALNIAQMVVLGVDNEGVQLGEYAPMSVQIREEEELQTDYIDLRFTGDFQESIELNATAEGFEIDATDSKWKNHIERRFPDALGLTDENEDRLTDVITKYIESASERYFETSTPATQLEPSVV